MPYIRDLPSTTKRKTNAQRLFGSQCWVRSLWVNHSHGHWCGDSRIHPSISAKRQSYWHYFQWKNVSIVIILPAHPLLQAWLIQRCKGMPLLYSRETWALGGRTQASTKGRERLCSVLAYGRRLLPCLYQDFYWGWNILRRDFRRWNYQEQNQPPKVI